ncbi:MAG: 23S rRNA (pseudouridine(1915)-N(3))-methyltransferase RlmH [Clostridia bacterium]|nr:23S rRNA (pseudouridine(1915)-N(3))-methyltransferase RlmH [Clostridia bacterium]
MQTINIICVGKLKEQYLKDAQKEYAKRLTAFCKLNIIELDESMKGPEEEGKAILNKIEKDAFVYAMCIEGKQMSSEKLSEEISRKATEGKSNLTFIIGGSLGLSDDVKNRADIRLSMSEMTFPHHLARIMLEEQIYRAYQINSNGKYHK